MFDSRSRIRLIIQAVEQIRDGVGPDGNWMIDLHQKFDFHEAVEVCRLMEPYRPFCVEDPVREEQFRTQIPKLRLLTTVPLAPGEEWGTRAEFSPLVEQRDIDFARASLPNVGGITEMLKIMAVCDTHKVGIVPHFTGPVATAGHMHTMMAFPGQVLMEYNQGERPVPYMPEFLDCKNGKVWPNDRPGLGVSVDEKQLTFIEAMTEACAGDYSPAARRLAHALVTVRSNSAGGVNAAFIPRCAMAITRARSFLLPAVIVATAAAIAIAGGAFRASAATAQTRRPPQHHRHPRRRHGLVGHRILRWRDSDAQSRRAGRARCPLHPVLQHPTLLADARQPVDRALSPSGGNGASRQRHPRRVVGDDGPPQ